MAILTRAFFGLVAALAVAGLLAGVGCTRRGKPSVLPTSSSAPGTTIYVSASTGSDATGDGSQAKPYKSLTKGVSAATAGGLTIALAAGDYNAANGEKFPIALPTGVSLVGTNYGGGRSAGTFIDGVAEDTAYEKLVGAPAGSTFTTLEVLTTGSVTAQGIYVGTSKLALPTSRAQYAAADVLGTFDGSGVTLGAGLASLPTVNAAGVIVPSGTLSCADCSLYGNDFALGALDVPNASTAPSIRLAVASTESIIAGKVVGILSDGTGNFDISRQTFEGGSFAYEDALQPLQSGVTIGTVDFGGGADGSTGGNVFLGAQSAEISVTLANETVSALGNTWNPNVQGANNSGQYGAPILFEPPSNGRNIRILRAAKGSSVAVGALSPPTASPSPSPSPSTSPSTSPSPSPTPT